MITVSNRILVRPEFSQAFESRFQERLGLVDSMPGFLAYRLLRPTKPDQPYVVMTFWESETHFRGWTSSPEFKEQHKRERTLPPEALIGPPQIEVHEVAQESGMVLGPRS
ncbi:antibiotic biosynthesis monooxygenase [bacterium]|nr:antibiotic biosynthesis monooxygenase [bacterium]